MPMLQWDQTLADYSQAYVATCPGEQISPYDERVDYGRFGVWYVGQSVGYSKAGGGFAGPNGHVVAIQSFAAEGTDWAFPQKCAAGKSCKRYTQIIWADTTRVGCGFASCGSTRTGPAGDYWVCSYAVGGNMRLASDVTFGFDPYELATSIGDASKCSSDHGSVTTAATTNRPSPSPSPSPTAATTTGGGGPTTASTTGGGPPTWLTSGETFTTPAGYEPPSTTPAATCPGCSVPPIPTCYLNWCEIFASAAPPRGGLVGGLQSVTLWLAAVALSLFFVVG